MHFTGAQLLMTLLERQGVDLIAGIPGGASLPMYDALRASRIRHVLARHEQGAGFIAQGYARTTGRAGVCFGTSGPGATNLVTAIADAKLDSIPLIAITGQVPLRMIGTDAFQEIDTYGLTVPITKHNFLVRSAAELAEVVPDAFRIALSGRPGPVAIDVPKDVQMESVELHHLPTPGRATPPTGSSPESLAAAAALIARAERPLILAGAGIVHSGCARSLLAFAERGDIPIATTLLGLGVVPHNHPLNLGMVGMHAARFTNLALDECDLLIALGIRFDDRAIGKAAEFCPRAAILHVDIDAAELGKIKTPTVGIESDCGEWLRAMDAYCPIDSRSAWRRRVAELRDRYPLEMPARHEPTSPYGSIAAVARLLPPEAIVTSDVGQHQMWAAQAFPFQRPRQWLTSGGLGTMGFGVPAAIGAALAEPERPVVCFTGDGSLLMNIQELATAAEEDANVKIIVLNNGHLGMVRQQQQLFYGGRYHASRFHHEPDFCRIAEGFGLAAYDLGHPDPHAALSRALSTPGPCLVNVPIAREANVYPMVPPGGANRDMIDGGSHVHA